MSKTLFLAGIFLSGLLLGWVAQMLVTGESAVTESSVVQTALQHTEQHLTPGYVCPMHPSVISNEAGSCPVCGMSLEAKKLSSITKKQGISVSPAMVNSLGVRVTHVSSGRISEQVFASGNVESVTSAITTNIQTKIQGRVKKVFAKAGDWVAEGEFILAIESEEFADLQARYLAAKKINDYVTVKALRQKLVLMDARQAVLDGVDRINNIELGPEFIVEAPHSGILEMVVQQGDRLEIGGKVARVATETIARVRLRSYARAARAIKRGRYAQLDLPHLPGLFWPGRVVEVNHGDAGFYSLIQADFEVPDDSVDKGIFVGAYVNAGTSEDVLRVPASAVIRVESESRVVVMRPDGSFEPQKIETGFVGNQWAEIKAGLEEGVPVVERAQFLIDSEATLRAGFSRMTE